MEKFPLFTGFLYIPGGAGFLPSTVDLPFWMPWMVPKNTVSSHHKVFLHLQRGLSSVINVITPILGVIAPVAHVSCRVYGLISPHVLVQTGRDTPGIYLRFAQVQHQWDFQGSPKTWHP